MKAFTPLSVLGTWARIELVTACTLLAAIVGLIGFQIVARSFFGAPLVWAEEAAMLCFFWVIFIGAGLAAKLGMHIQVSALEGVGGPGLALALNVFAAVVSAAALLYIGKLAYGFLPIEMRTTSIALPVDIPKAWFYSVPLIYATVSMTAGFLMSAWIGRTAAGHLELRGLRSSLLGDDHEEGVL